MPRRRSSKIEEQLAVFIVLVAVSCYFLFPNLPKLISNIIFWCLPLVAIVCLVFIAIIVFLKKKDAPIVNYSQMVHQRFSQTPKSPDSRSPSPIHPSRNYVPQKPLHLDPPQAKRLHFNGNTLRRIDWLYFELLTEELFKKMNFVVKKTHAGADGGVDIELFANEDSTKPSALIQCKARATSPIGVDKVRELFGVMAAMNVNQGILVCNTEFTHDAKAFANNNPKIKLGDLHWLEAQLSKLPQEIITNLESKYLDKEFDVPSCPQCERKLTLRKGKFGAFWGCRNFPKCHCKMNIQREYKLNHAT